jgi:hypothetical protein
MSIIIGELRALSNNRFRAAIDYYSAMIDSTDLFTNLPSIPKIVKRKNLIQRKLFKISLEDVRNHVIHLYSTHNK